MNELFSQVGLTSLASIPPMTYYYVAGIIAFVVIYFVVTKIVKRKGDHFTAEQMAVFEQKSDTEKQAMIDVLFQED